MAVLDFLAHQVIHVVLQFRQLAGEFLKPVDREFTYAGTFQCFGSAGIVLAAHAVQPHQFTRHEETGYLFFTAFGNNGCFDGAALDRKAGANRGTLIENMLAAVIDFPLLDNVLKAIKIVLFNGQR